MTLEFILATQPKEWDKLKMQYGAEAKQRFFERLSDEIAKRGALDELRKNSYRALARAVSLSKEGKLMGTVPIASYQSGAPEGMKAGIGTRSFR